LSITTSPSDYTAIQPDYAAGYGYYTDYIQVADLLQVPRFDETATYPTRAQVGNIIKRVEGIVDDKVKRSFRPIVTKKEFHNFEYSNRPGNILYGGYVGFIELKQMKVRKIISLQVWSGSGYKELASAQAQIKLLDNFKSDLKSIIIETPDSSISYVLEATSTLSGLGNDEFSTAFGVKTTANEITHLINEEFPSTSQFTGATAPKSLHVSNRHISNFFFAQKEEGNGANVLISSLLSGDDGADCIIKATTEQSATATDGSSNLVVIDSSKLHVGMSISTGHGIPAGTTITAIVDSTNVTMSANAGNGAGSHTLTFTTTTGIPNACSIVPFTDKEDMKRTGDYWLLGEEGRIFFLQDYPYHTRNSVIVSYIAGNSRVPSAIHEATTKLVAAEILRHDDQSVLITETGGNISTKEKYDILRKEGMDILKGKGDIVYLID
jgi:hypothetical protein